MNFGDPPKINPASNSGSDRDWAKAQTLAWATGCGVFGGSIAGYALQIILQKKEVWGSGWPAVLTLAVSAGLAAQFNPARRWLSALAAPILILASVLVATGLRDSSGDGLGSYAETIHWMIQSGRFADGQKEKEEFLKSLTQIRGSLSLGCIFSNVSGSYESAKWVGWAWSMAGALMLVAGIPALPGGFFYIASVFLMTLCQPVFLYQGSTLYQDCQTAGAMTAVFASFLAIYHQNHVLRWLGFFLSLVCLGLSKSFAMGYILVFLPFFLAVIFLRKNPLVPHMMAGIAIMSAWTVPLTFPLLREIRAKSETPISRNISGILLFADPVAIDAQGKDGIHGGCGEVVSSSAVMFWRRHFAASKRGGDEVKVKPPFWFTRPELDVFADLTPDLRFGGYGPLYSTSVLLALLPGLLLLLSNSPDQFGWKWILVACLVMIPISPSWWARWFPQGWWIPFAASVGFLSGPPDWQAKFKKVTWLARLGLLTLGLNSLLILTFTVKGYGEAESIIRRQLAFLKTVPAPLQIETGYFAATRFWLTQEKIPYMQKAIPGNSASMVLYRTSLRVLLADGDMQRIQQEPDFLKLLQKHKLLNLPPASQPSG